MLTPFDIQDMRHDAHSARNSYREVYMVIPTVTSGSNYNDFTDSPYDITGPQSGEYVPTYTTYRALARIKIIQDTTLLVMGQPVPGLEVGDYLLYFRDTDKSVLDKVVNNKDGYMVVDGNTLRPWNTSLNGVGQTFDVYCHAKKYSPRFRPTGL